METTITGISPNAVTTPSATDVGQPKITGNLTKLKIEEKGEAYGKPRFVIDSQSVINDKSGFFKKLLCDGLTFTAGQACAYSCTFCYVESALNRLKHLKQIKNERNLKFEDMVVEIKDAAIKARKYLTVGEKPKYNDPEDRRVIYGSPLVDIAATMDQVRETVEICKAILDLTHWQIRLLSKSSFLRQVAERIPVKYKDRVIYGLSTGTLDSDLAKSFEKGTALVSKRLATLKWLQENGYRTFGMVCPILPQKDCAAFAKQMAVTIDVEKCEHVWAEVINLRGDSLTATAQALQGAGYKGEADLLEKVMNDKTQWEEYARSTYEALAAVVPHKKLRFLQYVNKSNLAWWAERENQGAVLLKHAAPKKKRVAGNDNQAATTAETNHESETE
jgi:DNA repair photolyase